MQLITNADDFGLSPAVNYGILECMQNGFLTSATMMMNAPATDHAINLMKQYDLNIGIHLVASMFHPLTKDYPLVRQDGTFDKQRYFKEPDSIDCDALLVEWRAQLDSFIKKVGVLPTHIDSHHHAHMRSPVEAVIKQLADEYQLQVRNLDTPYGKHVHFYSEFYAEKATEETIWQAVKSGEIVELMVHPAFIDNTLLNVTTYNQKRADELDLLTNRTLMQKLKDVGVELISYNDTKL